MWVKLHIRYSMLDCAEITRKNECTFLGKKRGKLKFLPKLRSVRRQRIWSKKKLNFFVVWSMHMCEDDVFHPHLLKLSHR